MDRGCCGVVRVLAGWGSWLCGLLECGERCCGPVPPMPLGLFCAGSAAAVLPRWFSGYPRRLRAGRVAMSTLRCTPDRVTCAARARHRCASVCGWRRAVAGQGRGNVPRGAWRAFRCCLRAMLITAWLGTGQSIHLLVPLSPHTRTCTCFCFPLTHGPLLLSL